MNTLTLQQAAELLQLHPVTLRDKARAGVVPAAKVGKRWLFVEVDLWDWLRSQYRSRALQGDLRNEVSQCHSTNVKIHPCGGSSSASMDDAYKRALGLKTAKPPRNITTV
jgi:excisionase family DNA binding protein